MSYYSYDNGGRRGFLSNMPEAVKNIIIINILIMVMTSLNPDYMYEKFALFYPTSRFFHWWQPFTHMFMHGGFWHLFFNMYTLFIFGSVLERVWGSKKFLIFYFVTGLGAALIHTGVEWLEMQSWMASAAEGDMAAQISIDLLKRTPTVGASGAIYGVLMGYAMLYPDATFWVSSESLAQTASGSSAQRPSLLLQRERSPVSVSLIPRETRKRR